MTTYTCKCGKIFKKSGTAGTTGNRMPDYGPEHECFGCPFVIPITEGWPAVTVNYECRGSAKVRYGTYCRIGTADRDFCVSHVWTLDLEFAKRITEFFNTLEGIEQPKNTDFICRSSENGDDGMINFGFLFQHNKKGTAAKKEFYAAFFNDNRRIGITPEQEKETVLQQIAKAKEEAKAMNSYYAPCGHKFSRSAGGVPEITIEVTGTTQDCFTCPHALHEPETDEHGPKISCVCSRKKVEPADTPITFEEAAAAEPVQVPLVKYQKGSRVYYVRSYDNGTYRAFFYHESNPSDEIVCASIPPANTLEDAQGILDDYARKHDYEVFTEPTSEEETPLSPDLSSDDTAEAAGEPTENEPALQQEQDKTPDSENDRPDSPPDFCDWKNASGADEDEPDEQASDIPAGQSVSLRDNVFVEIIDACDAKINSALRVMLESHQRKFDFTAKISFNLQGDRLAVTHETGYKFEPINYKDKATLYEDIQIVLGADGNPMIPYDREHQINFDEIQPGRVIAPSGTVTVDGNTGIVERYQEDGEEPEDPDGKEQTLPVCDREDCPFHGANDNGCTGCCFDTEDQDDSSFPGDVWSAVHMESCKRPEVLEAYHQRTDLDDEDDGPGDTDYEGDGEMTDDVPPEQVIEEVGEPSEKCYEAACMFFNPDAPGNCAFNAGENFYGAPDNYPADEDDVIEAVKGYHCQKPELVAEYNKIKENENNDEN
jgi:hypothetical protein